MGLFVQDVAPLLFLITNVLKLNVCHACTIKDIAKLASEEKALNYSRALLHTENERIASAKNYCLQINYFN